MLLNEHNELSILKKTTIIIKSLLLWFVSISEWQKSQSLELMENCHPALTLSICFTCFLFQDIFSANLHSANKESDIMIEMFFSWVRFIWLSSFTNCLSWINLEMDSFHVKISVTWSKQATCETFGPCSHLLLTCALGWSDHKSTPLNVNWEHTQSWSLWLHSEVV